MGKNKLIGFCGDVCSECPRYIATKENSYKKLEYLAELWYRLGFRETIVDPETLKCQGCTNNPNCAHGINKCEELKYIDNCGLCCRYPCDKINEVFNKADYYKEKCKEKCNDTEYSILNRAFFLKRDILNKIHDEHISG